MKLYETCNPPCMSSDQVGNIQHYTSGFGAFVLCAAIRMHEKPALVKKTESNDVRVICMKHVCCLHASCGKQPEAVWAMKMLMPSTKQAAM